MPVEVGLLVGGQLAGTADRIDLTGLPTDDVAELLRRHGAPTDTALVRLVTTRTGGNPLFVAETQGFDKADRAFFSHLLSGTMDAEAELRQTLSTLAGAALPDLLGEVFGDAGKHARSAVGVAVLPLDAPVEVEVVAAVD